MDPIVRALADVRSLKEACDPFDRESLAEYFYALGKDMGFSPLKHPRKGLARVLCVWKDSGGIYLAADFSYGSEKEVLGAIMSLSAFCPHVGVLVTASKPFWGISDLLETLRTVPLNVRTLLVLDVKTGNASTWRGNRGDRP